MSFFRTVARPFERRNAIFPGALSVPPPGSYRQSAAGTDVNDQTTLSLMTFFAGVRLITDSITFLPLRAVTVGADGTRMPVQKLPVQLVSPFQAFTLQEGISQIVTSLILRGNAYLVAVAWDGGMNPIQWRIVSADQVSIDWDEVGNRRYKINGHVMASWRVTHVANFMLAGALKGAGIVEYCRNALGLGVALDEVAGSFFKNGIMSTGVIGVDAPLTPEEARSAAEQFVQNHSGSKNAHLPIVMGGGAKYTPMSLTAEDAQFLQSRQHADAAIATLLGIPPHLLGQVDRTTSWGTGIEVQGRAFVDFTLRPYIHRLQTMFTGWIEKGTYAEFVTDALTRADSTVRFQGYMRQLTDGWANVDEVRAQEGRPPLPNGAGQIFRTPATQLPSSDPSGVIATAPPAPLAAQDPNTGDPNAGDEN
jgi:HK97 family phage portal protein